MKCMIIENTFLTECQRKEYLESMKAKDIINTVETKSVTKKKKLILKE